MKITREESATLEVTLNVELEPDDMEPYLDRSIKRLANRVQIPGFRKGKAPRYLMENYIGREALVRESLDTMLQESLDKAIKEENLEVFGEPDVEMVEVDPPSFKAVVPLEPIVDLGDFRSIRMEPEPIEVNEEQVNKVVERLQYDAAPWEPVERPVKFGDQVTLDVDGFIDGEQVADDRGVDFIPAQDNPTPFPGFSIYLEGMAKDESKEFTLAVPEDSPDDTISGKECRFNVKILEIKEQALPELDDEFAKGVGDEYESLEALRDGILENLIAQTENATKITFQEKSLTEVVKGASVQVSDLTANREIDHLLEDHMSQEGQRVDMDTYLRNAGKSREELRDEVRPNAQDRMARYLVIRKLARDENIEVSPDEIDAEVENLVASMGQSGESIRQAFSTESARSSISSAILNRKVLERLAEIVQGGAGVAEEEPFLAEAQDSVEDAPVSAVEVGPEEEPEIDSEAATPQPQIVGSGQPDEAQGDEGGTPSDDQSL